MIEPPSQQLIQTLSEFGLCKPGDLRRCRPLVRRLAHDLPAFDSVWIDALVHTRKLTHYQARELESGRQNRLGVGPCLLLNRLGHSEQAETFLARHRGSRQKSVLKLIEVSIEERQPRLAALQELTETLHGVSHPSFVAPHTCLEHDGRLVAISRHVPGLHLGELLVRRGRFRSANVLAIAQQLIDALVTLEGQGRVHGDISLSNVRLTSAGVAALVDTGVSTAVRPELTIHAHRTPDRYDGVAPELIGTGNRPTMASDLYALGCMLWQLLAGRPPYPTGDPLAKLAAHQTKTIRDVRDWAPDTPDLLADVIGWMTAANPHDRPENAAAVRARMGAPGRVGRQRLRSFRATFETAAPRSPLGAPSSAPRRWGMAMLLVVSTIVGIALFDPRTRADPLSVPSRISHYIKQQAAEWSDNPSSTPTEAPGPLAGTTADQENQIPLPNAEGIVLLDSPEPYAWRDLKWEGPLVIRGKEGIRPTIVVRSAACRVVADKLSLENVHVVHQPASDAATGDLAALLMVRSRSLSIVSCSFETHGLTAETERDESPVARPVAVAWKRMATDDGDSQIALRDTVFAGRSAALYLADTPTGIESVNCAKIGRGALLALADYVPAGKILSMHLAQLTLRRADSLLEWRAADANGARGFVGIQASDCVFDLSGSRPALIHFSGDPRIDASTTRIEVVGEESLARPGLEMASRLTEEGKLVALRDYRVVELEGITTGPFTFSGPVSRLPGDAVINAFEMPRRSPQPPGIDASRLAISQPTLTAPMAN